jgi:hypothetical protein
MTVKILSPQDVDRFVSAAFIIKRIVNCALSTNSGMKNSSICHDTGANFKGARIETFCAWPWERRCGRETFGGLSALRRLWYFILSRAMRGIEDESRMM